MYMTCCVIRGVVIRFRSRLLSFDGVFKRQRAVRRADLPLMLVVVILQILFTPMPTHLCLQVTLQPMVRTCVTFCHCRLARFRSS